MIDTLGHIQSIVAVVITAIGGLVAWMIRLNYNQKRLMAAAADYELHKAESVEILKTLAQVKVLLELSLRQQGLDVDIDGPSARRYRD